MNKKPIITIDGPSGAGKSTVSKRLAQTFGFTYIDTGAMFRAVALAAHQRNIAWENADAIAAMLPEIQVGFCRVQGSDHVTLNGEDVEIAIREHHISQGASQVAVHPQVRSYLLDLQRELGQRGGVILEGRDTGTVVFPQADIKIFLDASPTERAQRRLAQLGPASGEDFASILEAIESRDRRDTQREMAPLRCADDAVRIDASTLSLDGVVAAIADVVLAKRPDLMPERAS